MEQETNILDNVCTPERVVDQKTLCNVIMLAVELAREGREGRQVGTLLVIGDPDELLDRSESLILDPLLNHPDEVKDITDSNMRETVKELSQLDGAFIVSEKGIVVSACQYINASSENLNISLGLGSRHLAAASITKEVNAVAVVVSQSSIVRVFENGEIISEIIPELWMLSRYSSHMKYPFTKSTEDQVTVFSKDLQ